MLYHGMCCHAMPSARLGEVRCDMLCRQQLSAMCPQSARDGMQYAGEDTCVSLAEGQASIMASRVC